MSAPAVNALAEELRIETTLIEESPAI